MSIGSVVVNRELWSTNNRLTRALWISAIALAVIGVIAMSVTPMGSAAHWFGRVNMICGIAPMVALCIIHYHPMHTLTLQKEDWQRDLGVVDDVTELNRYDHERGFHCCYHEGNPVFDQDAFRAVVTPIAGDQTDALFEVDFYSLAYPEMIDRIVRGQGRAIRQAFLDQSFVDKKALPPAAFKHLNQRLVIAIKQGIEKQGIPLPGIVGLESSPEHPETIFRVEGDQLKVDRIITFLALGPDGTPASDHHCYIRAQGVLDLTTEDLVVRWRHCDRKPYLDRSNLDDF